MSSKAEIVIIGAGVVGCSIAYHLAKQGVPSQIIEKDAIASQASGRAWGVISAPAAAMILSEGTEKDIARACQSLFEEGLRRFPQLAEELKEEGGVDIGFGELPLIYAVFDESEEKYLKERMSELEREGFEVSWLEGDEVKARFPDIAPGVRGGLLFPGQQVEPYRYTLALAQAAEKMGASIKLGEAVGFRYQGTRVNAVTLATGRMVAADVVVLAMGPWTGQGTSWLGKEIPMSIGRAQSLRVEVPQRLPPYQVSCSRKGDLTIVPRVDGTVVLGQWVEDEVDFDDMPTEKAKRELVDAAVDLVPRLEDAKLIEHIAGLEGYPPDDMPLLGNLPGWENVYLAVPAVYGINWSPAIGRIMANLIVKGTEKSIGHLSPARLYELGDHDYSHLHKSL